MSQSRSDKVHRQAIVAFVCRPLKRQRAGRDESRTLRCLAAVEHKSETEWMRHLGYGAQVRPLYLQRF